MSHSTDIGRHSSPHPSHLVEYGSVMSTPTTRPQRQPRQMPQCIQQIETKLLIYELTSHSSHLVSEVAQAHTCSSMASEMSTPTTLPMGPAAAATANATVPVPQHTSRTDAPG